MYIFWFLHQTTTLHPPKCESGGLYIFWFLHQTTTGLVILIICARCISFDSYIKPQPTDFSATRIPVVYLLIPTSNHNWAVACCTTRSLYIFWFLHQTTTFSSLAMPNCLLYIFWFLHQTTTCHNSMIFEIKLYIFWFLHQTTTVGCHSCIQCRCISFDSYIKPQQKVMKYFKNISCISFDSYIKPQPIIGLNTDFLVVYLLIPTSNHNAVGILIVEGVVVYLLIPTSNHNSDSIWSDTSRLYIFWFLHQTTTPGWYCTPAERCISFDSYIKPQHSQGISLVEVLYIFWFLHQTTTGVS